MYGHATSLPQATGLGRRWILNKKTNCFERSNFYEFARGELEYLSFIAYDQNIEIQHRWNMGHVLNIAGKCPDGYHPESRTCYFYDGCRFHDCFCQKQRQTAEDEKLGERRRKRDYAIRKKLEAQGYKVVVMRECVWYRRKREDEV